MLIPLKEYRFLGPLKFTDRTEFLRLFKLPQMLSVGDVSDFLVSQRHTSLYIDAKGVVTSLGGPPTLNRGDTTP